MHSVVHSEREYGAQINGQLERGKLKKRIAEVLWITT